MSVDFPAPFSPTSACTSPRCSSRSTPARAMALPKLFLMPAMRSRARSSLMPLLLEGLIDKLGRVPRVKETVLQHDLWGQLRAAPVAFQCVECKRPEAWIRFHHSV